MDIPDEPRNPAMTELQSAAVREAGRAVVALLARHQYAAEDEITPQEAIGDANPYDVAALLAAIACGFAEHRLGDTTTDWLHTIGRCQATTTPGETS